MPKLALTCVLIAMCFALANTAGAQQPYAGLQARSIKALSDEQIADLGAGRGMTLALAAELNGYPGPAHVLELSDPLGLSDAQIASVRNLFAAMKAEAVPLGERLIRQEADLDRLFSNKAITTDALSEAIKAIGGTQAELRGVHLKYHLSTHAILTSQQIERYAQLRGYTHVGEGSAHQHH
jgi:hypothetical protein